MTILGLIVVRSPIFTVARGLPKRLMTWAKTRVFVDVKKAANRFPHATVLDQLQEMRHTYVKDSKEYHTYGGSRERVCVALTWSDTLL